MEADAWDLMVLGLNKRGCSTEAALQVYMIIKEGDSFKLMSPQFVSGERKIKAAVFCVMGKRRIKI